MVAIVVPEGSNSVLAILAETTLGDVPASPHFSKVRHTSAGFNPNLVTQNNEEISGSGQGAGTKLTMLDGGGSVSYNAVIAAHPLFEKSALRAVDKTGATITCVATCAFSSVGNTITLSGAQLNGFSVVIPGMVLKITGASPAGNNGFKTILTKTSDSIVTVKETLVTQAAGAATIKWSKQTTGVTLSSVCAEHSYTTPSLIKLITGIVAKAWSFSASTRGLVTGKFDFLTLSQSHPDTSVETSTYGAAPSAAFDILNSTSNLQYMSLAKYNANGSFDADITSTFKSVEFSADNGAEYVDSIGDGLYPVGISCHDVTVKATVQAYYRNKALFEAGIAQNKLCLRFALTDGDVATGNWKFFCMPMCDILDVKFNETKKNEDGMVTITLQAKLDTYVTGQSLIMSEHLAA